MISAAQLRAARGLLNLTQEELASLAGMTAQTVKDFERSARRPQPRTIRDIIRVLEERGVEFIDDGKGGLGVLLRSADDTR